MLEIKNVSKIYETDGFKQKALDDVSVCFRESEFASILGPSGSGKTTLLNIIGGLDQYTSGDLIINEISTKKFKDINWDTYRNHRIGFVFQSYNLISHQSILSNVELALTLSGEVKSERRKRAIEALKKVGLKDHINKRPNQMSGGQMQRVAIARALVNNPDILLADEPTGALDSETSVQIMNILKEIAKEKLVIMVTHNSEIAKKYSTRIIKLKDGKIIDDTRSYDGGRNTSEAKETTSLKSKKTNMNIFTALSLSLNNLLTKKGRTFLTAFAGSIGIIGIALILALSSGVNNYIERMEKETLSSYPIELELDTVDFTSIMGNIDKTEIIPCKKGSICTVDDISLSPLIQIEEAKVSNNLKEFKKYIDGRTSDINKYVTDIKYSYNVDLQIFSKNTKDNIIKVNPNSFTLNPYAEMQSNQMAQTGINIPGAGINNNVFRELIGKEDLINSQYTILSGKMPEKYNELVLIVDENNNIPATLMYSLNIEDREVVNKIIKETKKDDKPKIDSIIYKYEDFIGLTYSLILNTDYYIKENGVWIDKSLDLKFLENKIENGLDLSVVGVAKISDDAVEASSGYIGYKTELISHTLNQINKTDIAIEQTSKPKLNVFSGQRFDGIINTYESNLSKIGITKLDEPFKISIYPNSFEAKKQIEQVITDYNKTMEDDGKLENKISYTDFIGVLLTSVTSAINIITYILVAFVAISLVVSSIMISIITYVSVLERTKEIGILRAMGASKKDVARVFRAETIIEGFIAGVFGVLTTVLLSIPINKIIYNALDVNDIAKLPLMGGLSLIFISVFLTVIAGYIPARMASKKDPVEALRTD